MHTKHYFLIFYLSNFCHAFQEAAPGSLSSPHLLPDAFFSLNDYEVLSVREESDEDVIHVRKRAGDENCGTDCLTYSGWESDGIMRCDPEITDDEDPLVERSLLKKRERKTAKGYR